MLDKGINIFHVNTLGVDDEFKALPTCRELSKLQSVAGDLIHNRAYRYLGEIDSDELYTQLTDIGVKIKNLEVPDAVNLRRNALLDNLRPICIAVKNYSDNLVIGQHPDDKKNVEWSQYHLVNEYETGSDWYGTPGSDESILGMLAEFKRIKHSLIEPMEGKCVQYAKFNKLGEQLIKQLADKYLS